MLEAEVDALAEALSVFDIKLEQAIVPPTEDDDARGKAAVDADGEADPDDDAASDKKNDRDVVLRELAVLPGSSIVGRSASEMHLRARYGLNLLAVSREGRLPRSGLRKLALKSGDLLLVQGPADANAVFVTDTGCVPLGARELRIASTVSSRAAEIVHPVRVPNLRYRLGRRSQ